PAEVTEAYPTKLPPLRADAPTLVIGRMKAGKTLAYKVTGTVPGRPGAVTVEMSEAGSAAGGGNYVLVSMLAPRRKAGEQARRIRADRALVFAYERNRLAKEELLAQAQAALHQQELEVAAQLYEQARQLAPHDAEAKAGLRIVAHLRDGKLTPERLREQ